MDKKKKIWAGLVLFLCAVLIVQFFYSSPSWYFRADDGADGVYEVYIDDSYGLLDSEEQENLRRIMLELTEYGNMVFASSNSIVGNTREKARDVYQSNFGRESGVIFFIDMSNRTIWIESYGDARNALSSSVCYEITDRTYNYATGGNYYECAEETFSRVGEVLRRGFLFPTMRVLISLCVALMLALIINLIRLQASRGYVPKKENKMSLYGVFTGSAVQKNVLKTKTKRYYESSQRGGSSSGGSSGGGSSSGGSSGGGHSF